MSTQLTIGTRVTLAVVAGVVTGRCTLGPASSPGPAYWDVDTVIYKTSRPGTAPIPRIEVYLDDAGDPANLQFVSYDGSFGQARGTCRLTRGQQLIAVWTGGTAGDIAYLTLNGTKG